MPILDFRANALFFMNYYLFIENFKGPQPLIEFGYFSKQKVGC